MNQEHIPVAKPVETQTAQPQTPPAQTTGSPDAASGRAIAALILGILSIICLGLLAGIPGIIIGNMELKDIRAGKASKAGESMAKVGLILSIIGTALNCLILLGTIALIILGVSVGSMENWQTAVLSV